MWLLKNQYSFIEEENSGFWRAPSSVYASLALQLPKYLYILFYPLSRPMHFTLQRRPPQVSPKVQHLQVMCSCCHHIQMQLLMARSFINNNNKRFICIYMQYNYWSRNRITIKTPSEKGRKGNTIGMGVWKLPNPARQERQRLLVVAEECIP